MSRGRTSWAPLAIVLLMVTGCAGSGRTSGSGTLSTGSSPSAQPSSQSSGGASSTAAASSPNPTSPSATSPLPSSIPGPPHSPGTTVPVIAPGPSCPARASGRTAGRLTQTIFFAAPGVQHEWPDNRVRLNACASSGLPVTFSLVGTSVNCTLTGTEVTATTTMATCQVVAGQTGDSRYAPAIDQQRLYVVNSQPVHFTWLSPVTTSGVVGRTVQLGVAFHANAPFQLASIGLQAEPPDVCSAPDAISGYSGDPSHPLRIPVRLLAAGTCTLQLVADGSENVQLDLGALVPPLELTASAPHA